MHKNRIRIGFVGLKPDSQWAARAHIPALKYLSDEFEITGVANSSLQSSQAAAIALGIPHAFEDAYALIQSPEVDLIVVTVKVPFHRELVLAALSAGKHVFCEWPLGNGLTEAREMADLAGTKGLIGATSTQMRVAPEVVYLKTLIAQGYIGKVLSTTLTGSGGGWGAATVADQAYTFDKSKGATLLSIPLGHTLAGFVDVLGDIDSLSARMLNLRKSVLVTDADETVPKTTEDQIMVHRALKNGAAFSVHYRGGLSRGTNFLWEINGTEGDIQVTAPVGHPQLVPLSIHGARGDEKALKPLHPSADGIAGWPENPMVRNIAHVYELIAKDIQSGTRTAPSFHDAVKLHETLERIERSAETAGRA